MVSVEEVVQAYEFARGTSKNRSFRITKTENIPKKLEKMKESARKALLLFTKQLNTTHINIDLKRWMLYGFELWPNSFSYNHLSNEKLLNYYIVKDKNLKRETDNIESEVKKSVVFVIRYCSENKISLKEYCRQRDENLLLISNHFMKGYIDKYFVYYMIYTGYIIIKDQDRQNLNRIIQSYRELKRKILENERFFINIKEYIEERV